MQRAESARTALLAVTDAGARAGGTSPGSFAAVTLDARRRHAVWSAPSLLDSVEGEVTVLRNRHGRANVAAAVAPDREAVSG